MATGIDFGASNSMPLSKECSRCWHIHAKTSEVCPCFCHGIIEIRFEFPWIDPDRMGRYTSAEELR